MEEEAQGSEVTAGSVLVFRGKLAALEVLRRTTQARCRLVWWAVEGLAVAGAPGLGWLRRFAPLRAVADASESFSEPMIFLLLTTVVASAYHEAKTSGSVSEKVPRSVVETGTREIEEDVVVVDKQASSDALMIEELKKHGVVLPEEVGDDEVKRFWLASKGDTAKFVSTVRKTQEWRQSYDFMTKDELREWSHLAFWHLRDVEGRPVLVIRLGLACTTLAPAQLPQMSELFAG